MADIIFPESGESVRTGVIASLRRADGDVVRRDESIVEIETDKIMVEVPAPAAGRIRWAVKPGQEVQVGSVLGSIDESAAAPSPASAPPAPPAAAAPASAPAPARPVTPAPNGKPAATPAPVAAQATEVRATPLARKIAEEHGLDLSAISGTGAGGRVREQDVLAAVGDRAGSFAPASAPTAPTPSPRPPAEPGAGTRRERLSPLRQRIAQRLVEAQHAAAMLTTFNEVDMTAVVELRKRYKEDFEKRHAVGLGFMSFFIKAAAAALQRFPLANACIVPAPGGALEVEHHDGCHIAVAVSTPKGLTVPVLRNCERLSFAQVEAGIKDLAAKARDGKLTLDDLQGGTFTITNGGVFGSLMSTPILNPPQTAILGMHAIKNRAVEDPDRPGQVALRPMMYLAVSYDHRLLDGAEAVSFLVAIKSAIEHPERLLIGL